jgi:hypothetical protein
MKMPLTVLLYFMYIIHSSGSFERALSGTQSGTEHPAAALEQRQTSELQAHLEIFQT